MIRQTLFALALGLAGGLLLIAWASEEPPVPACAVPVPATEIKSEVRT